MTREPIYAGLFAILLEATGLNPNQCSRRWKHFMDVPPEQQPCLFQTQEREMAEQRKGLPPKWSIDVSLHIYVWAPTPTTIPSQLLNPIVDAIDTVLAPTPGPQNVNTLGGLVAHCWISAPIQYYEGALGQQAVAVVPISIVTA